MVYKEEETKTSMKDLSLLVRYRTLIKFTFLNLEAFYLVTLY